jgi:hypothetical protein
VTTLSPGMLGTVNVCVPELELEELVACGELVGCAEAVAVAERLGAAECVRVGELDGVGDDAGVLVNEAVGDPPARADDPLGAAAADVVAEGVDPLAPHALKPAPQMTAATITAGTRRILMLLPSVK